MLEARWNNMMKWWAHKNDTPEYQQLLKMRDDAVNGIKLAPVAEIMEQLERLEFKDTVEAWSYFFIKFTGMSKDSLVTTNVECNGKSTNCSWGYVREDREDGESTLSTCGGKCSVAEVLDNGNVIIDGEPLIDLYGPTTFSAFFTWNPDSSPPIITVFKVDASKK